MTKDAPKKSAGRKPDTPAADEPDADLSYEEAREALIEVVRQLEAGGTTLEESLALWERGERLASTCQAWLDGARERLEAALSAEGASEDDQE